MLSLDDRQFIHLLRIEKHNLKMSLKEYAMHQVSVWLTERNFVFPTLHKYSGKALLALLRSPDKDIPLCLRNDEDERVRLFAELRGSSEQGKSITLYIVFTL